MVPFGRLILGFVVLTVPLAAGGVSYSYDTAGRLVKANYGAAGTVVYAYDAAGNLISRQKVIAPDLVIIKTHSGNFTQGQLGATYTVNVSNAGAGPTSGTVAVTETVPSGLTLVSMAGTGWACPINSNACARSDALAAGASYSAIAVVVNVNVTASSPQINEVTVSGGGSAAASALDSTIVGALPPPILTAPVNGAGGIALTTTLNWNASPGATSYDVYFGTSPSPPFVANTTFLSYTPATLGAGITYFWQIVARKGAGSGASAIWSFTATTQAAVGLQFVPVTPCRVADTRNPTGPFGGPSMGAQTTRDFAIPASACGIPSTARAYALNITVVPHGPLGWLTLWPAGESQPYVSTLNSYDGRVKANAAIVPAGVNGAVSLFVTDLTDVVIDLAGYFVPPGNSTLTFYPLTPCRIADTRGAIGTFGGPSLVPNVPRNLPIPASACNVPATAKAYSLNMTVVPDGPLGWLTTWPAGNSEPLVSTLNAPTGAVTANAAIVAAGSAGAISVLATNHADLVIDINGYFAPAGGQGAVSLYTVTPCRIVDTRGPAGPFGAPQLSAGIPRSFPIPSSGCQIPSLAQAFSLNATVVPPASLNYLTLYGSGSLPVVSTLNDGDSTVVSNAAIVPAASDGSVRAYASDATQLILDINGYFAP